MRVSSRPGEVVTMPGVHGDEQIMLIRRCDCLPTCYACVTCRIGLRNLGNVEMHCESPGEHAIVVFCMRHTTYEAIDAPRPDAQLAVPL